MWMKSRSEIAGGIHQQKWITALQKQSPATQMTRKAHQTGSVAAGKKITKDSKKNCRWPGIVVWFESCIGETQKRSFCVRCDASLNSTICPQSAWMGTLEWDRAEQKLSDLTVELAVLRRFTITFMNSHLMCRDQIDKPDHWLDHFTWNFACLTSFHSWTKVHILHSSASADPSSTQVTVSV